MDALTWALATYRQRRIREDYFGVELFSEPGWDILLDLFIAHLQGRAVRQGVLGGENIIPATTILRYARILEKAGFIRRARNPGDARQNDVTLSDKGIAAMHRLCAASPLRKVSGR